MNALKRLHLVLPLMPLLVLLHGGACNAAVTDDQVAVHASNSITPFLVVGELSLAAESKKGKPEAIQGAKALVVTGLLTEALKMTVRERRPHNNSRTSFPSGHASSAFAMATVVAEYHPRYKWAAYGAATLIGWSRVEVGAHYWHDVVAGAALGYYATKYVTRGRLAAWPGGLGLHWKW